MTSSRGDDTVEMESIFSPKKSDQNIGQADERPTDALIPNGDTSTNSVKANGKIGRKDKKKSVKRKSEEVVKPDWLIKRENDPNIDGGWGWWVVFGSFMIHVVADGIAYAFGIIILELTTHFETGMGETSWVASLMIGITFASGPIASTFTNVYGCRVTTIIGSIVTSVGFVVSLFAPNIYFLYFSFGILGGLGLGLIYLPAIVSVGQYFEKKRSFATGLAVCGSGVGTFAFAPLIQQLVEEYQWKGATLIMAGLVLNCICFGALFRPIDVPIHGKTEENGDGAEKKQLISQADNELLFEKLQRAAENLRKSEKADHKNMITSCPQLETHGVVRTRRAGGLQSSNKLHASGPIIHVSSWYHSSAEVKAEIFNTYKSNHMLHFMSLANITEEEDIPEQNCKGALKEAFHQLADFALLSNLVFMLFAISNFCTSIGFNAPYIYLPDMAHIKGINKENASFLISVIGIGNTFGRVFFGYISDLKSVRKWQSGKLGRLTIYAVALTLCGISTCLSPYASNYGLMVVYAASYGILVGTYVTLTAVVLVDLIGLDRLTSSFGLLLLFQGIATFIGPPIAGWLYDITGSYDFSFYIIGFMITISGAMLLIYFAPFVKNQIIPPTLPVSQDVEGAVPMNTENTEPDDTHTPCNTPVEVSTISGNSAEQNS